MKHLVIIGTGNIGQIVHWYATLSSDYMKKWDIKCHINNVETYEIEPDDVFVNAEVKATDRFNLSKIIRDKGGVFVNIIHPTANIAPSAKLGTGIVVGAFTTISINTDIKNDVLIQDHNNVGHDVIIEDGSHLYVGVKLCGKNCIGQMSSIYTGAVVYPHIKIGACSTIGAGSVVSRKVKEGDMVLGNPAKKIEF